MYISYIIRKKTTKLVNKMKPKNIFIMGILGIFLMNTASADIADIIVRVPEFHTYAGESLSVPIEVVSDLTGEGLRSCDIIFTYNPDLLTAHDVTRGELIPPEYIFDYDITHSEGKITIGFFGASDNPLEGSGVIARINFTVNESTVAGASSPLTLERVKFGGVDVPSERLSHGGVIVVEDVDIAEINVHISDFHAPAGESIKVPIEVSDTTGKGILAADINFTYDPYILTAREVSQTEFTSGYSFEYDVKPGQVIINLAGDSPLEGSGALAEILFEVNESGVAGDGSPLRLDDVQFNAGEILPRQLSHNIVVVNETLLDVPVRYCKTCSDCNKKIQIASAGHTVYLTEDILNHSEDWGNCIESEYADGITFDCQGNSIEGALEGYGIRLRYGSNNIIKNCNVSQFEYGISISSSNNILIDNTANYNNRSGIGAGSNNILTGNTANYNGENGISTSDNNILTGNTATHNGENGIYLYESTNNTLTQNTANHNSNDGIYLYESTNNTLTNNEADNNMNGIELDYRSHDNELTGNTANENSNDGIRTYYANNIVFTQNRADSNNEYGIYIRYSDNYVLTGNIADSNSRYGIYLSESDNGKLTGNTANYNFNDGVHIYRSYDNVLDSNLVCYNTYYDLYLKESSRNAGDENTCDKPDGWNDNDTEGCTYPCPGTTTTIDPTPFCNSCSDCQSKINSASAGDIIYLTEDITSTDTCIKFIYVGGVTFDCQGYKIEGDSEGIGIFFDYSSNNELRNCYVSQFYWGIRLENSDNNNLTGNTANNNDVHGFSLSESDNNVLTSNTANSNKYGIGLRESYDNILTGNTANNNDEGGIILGDSDNNILTGNTANNNIDEGIYLHYSDDNNLTGNTAESNEYGISLYFSNSNTLNGNTANSNSKSGILLQYYSQDNTLTENTADFNGEWGGIWLYSSNYNELIQNTINENSEIGILLWYSSDNLLNSNHVCYNPESDFYLAESVDNTGDENTCDKPDGWNDNDAEGCTYPCPTTTSTTTSTSSTTTTTTTSTSTTSSTTSTTTSTTSTSTTTLPSAKCWSAENRYLKRNSYQAKKFCRCAEGTYDYKSYRRVQGLKLAHKYVNPGDNDNWETTPKLSYRPVYKVMCADGGWYNTNKDYYT